MRDFHQEAADGGLFLLQEGAMAMEMRTHFSFASIPGPPMARASSSMLPASKITNLPSFRAADFYPKAQITLMAV